VILCTHKISLRFHKSEKDWSSPVFLGSRFCEPLRWLSELSRDREWVELGIEELGKISQLTQFIFNSSINKKFQNNHRANWLTKNNKMKTTRILFSMGENVRISPRIYSDNKIDVEPGDLSKFAPMGNGCYGYQNSDDSNPFLGAPKQDACGGIIYFDNSITKQDFEALMRIMGIQPANFVNQRNDFALFCSESEEPGKDGYLAQIRVVPKFGLCYLFGAINEDEYDNFFEQKMNICETLWLFIENERKRWGTSFMQDEEKGLIGLFGGDGDFKREELSFGLMLENSYYNICRIWSRGWLVTK
jgi:hypothetical protein